jgi:putative transposase
MCNPLAPVPSEILDQFVRQGPIAQEELEAAVRRFNKAIIERALGGELTHHLGYPPGGSTPDDSTNHRNGTGSKTVLTDDGPLAIEVPRDPEGSFAPRFIPTPERRVTGFDDKILALYARGMTVREIQGFLAEMYAVEVSPDLISGHGRHRRGSDRLAKPAARADVSGRVLRRAAGQDSRRSDRPEQGDLSRARRAA